MGHVEREGDALREHLVHALDHVLGRARLVAGAPLVEPSAPELRAHLRRVGAQLAQAAELLVDVGARAEVHGPRQVVEAVLLEVARPVALEQLNLLAIDATQTVAYLRDVGLVLAIRAVLVLHLYHDDGAAILNGQRLQLLAHLLLEDLHALHEVGVALAQADVLLLQQPPGQAAHLPLGTHIGSGSHDDVHAVLLSQTAELSHIVLTREVEHVLLLLMDVPEDVDAHGVHAQRLTHLDAVLPVGTRDTGVVYFGRLHDEGLAVEQEGAFASGKRAGLTLRGSCCGRVGHGGHSQQHRCQREDGNDFSEFHLFYY